VRRAGGIPFFVEEIVRVLVDTGVLEGARGSYRLQAFSGIEVPPQCRRYSPRVSTRCPRREAPAA